MGGVVQGEIMGVKKPVLRTVKEYLFITFGLMCYVFSLVAVVLPAGIVGGGVSGISILIFHATGGAVPLAYSILGINAILIIVASFIIGFKFSTKTVYAVIVMALATGFFQELVPPNILGLADEKLMSALLGGGLYGMGIGLCFMNGGSTGGTDIIAMIINKFRQISYGRIIMACDFVIIGSSYFISQDITTVIFSFVLVAVTGYTVDAVMAGNNQSSQLFIISKQYQNIARMISEEAKRGVTVIDGKGWYAQQDVKVLMVVCRKDETNTILRFVKEVDPKAFTTVANVMGVYGQGFEMLNPKKEKRRKS